MKRKQIYVVLYVVCCRIELIKLSKVISIFANARHVFSMRFYPECSSSRIWLSSAGNRQRKKLQSGLEDSQEGIFIQMM